MDTGSVPRPAAGKAPTRFAWALTLIWIAIIAFESTYGSPSNTSSLLRPLLNLLLPHLTAERFALVHDAIRKTGHLTGYAILSFLSYRSWWTTLLQAGATPFSWRMMMRRWSGRAALLALLTTLAVAGADELHQSFEPTRTGSVADVALDEMGGWLAQSMIVIFSSVSLARRVHPRNAEPERITSS